MVSYNEFKWLNIPMNLDETIDDRDIQNDRAPSETAELQVIDRILDHCKKSVAQCAVRTLPNLFVFAS